IIQEGSRMVVVEPQGSGRAFGKLGRHGNHCRLNVRPEEIHGSSTGSPALHAAAREQRTRVISPDIEIHDGPRKTSDPVDDVATHRCRNAGHLVTGAPAADLARAVQRAGSLPAGFHDADGVATRTLDALLPL